MTRPPAPSASRLRDLLRLGLVPLLLSLSGGLLAGLVLGGVLDRAIAGRTEASALALLDHVGPDLEAVLGSGQEPREAVARLGRQLSLRVTLVDAGGKVLGDSAVEPARLDSLENHADRPEIRAALASGTGVQARFSGTLGERLVYAAARLRGGEVLRLAFPERALSDWEAPYRRRTIGISVLAGLLVAALLVYARARHAAELRSVGKAVAEATRGDRPRGERNLSEEAAAVVSALGELAALVSEREAGARRDAAVARAVFDAVPVGVLVVDASLSLLDANPETIRLLGAEPGSLRRGEHVLVLVRERSVADFLEAALRVDHLTDRLALPPEKGGRILEASAVRLPGEPRPGQAAVLAVLSELPPP